MVQEDGRSGDVARILPADQRISPGSGRRAGEAVTRTTLADVGWTTARALDLLPDGSTVSFDRNPAEGRIERGEVLRHWLSHDYSAQVHPATLCMRRDLVFALGGWMALPASEDTGLLLTASTLTPGYFIHEPGLLYRKWPGQMTSRVEHADEIERPARMAIIAERVRALAAVHSDVALRHSWSIDGLP